MWRFREHQNLVYGRGLDGEKLRMSGGLTFLYKGSIDGPRLTTAGVTDDGMLSVFVSPNLKRACF